MASPPQFTCAQVLEAARRAEAEGKLDYALQFYRHIVDHYAAEPEAFEARDGFHRLTNQKRAEQMRGPYGPTQATAHGGPFTHQLHADAHARAMPVGARDFRTPPDHRDQASPPLPGRGAPGSAQGARNLPQVIPRGQQLPVDTEPEFAFKDRYRAGTMMAQGTNWLGWIAVGVGTALAIAGLAGVPKSLAAPALLGLPSGLVYGLEAAAAGLALVFLSQLALAVFDNANATRNLLAIERAKAEL